MGRVLSKILEQQTLTLLILQIAVLFPFVLKQISDHCKGSTRSFLNQEILKKLLFVFPPLLEQIQIVLEVERRLSIADEVELQINTNLKRAERLRQRDVSVCRDLCRAAGLGCALHLRYGWPRRRSRTYPQSHRRR